MTPCTISYLMSCAINIKWLEGVWATTTIGGRVNRRDKKAAAQMNAKSIKMTLSLTVLMWVGLIFTCKCVMWASFIGEIHEGEIAHTSESQ